MSAPADPAGVGSTDARAAEIVFDRVTKRYEGRDGAALDDLSFVIPAGTFCVLVGPSGGGKTTALKLINRLIDFDEGDVTIDGHSVRELPLVELRRGIGYVIQQIGLFPHMTIADNIATVPRLLGWSKARTKERTTELLDLVGLGEEYAPRYPAQLSGGQRQRVGLARALAADPPVLLMDEPFGALDPITRARLQQEMRRLHDAVSKTIVFVTHDIDEAITLGDRIAILREGGVLAQYDTPDAILARPADEFVEQFVGEDRALRRLALRRVGELELDPAGGRTPEAGVPLVAPTTTVRNAVSLMLQTASECVLVAGDDGEPRGLLRLERVEEILRVIEAGQAGGPVIPDFGKGSSCVTGDHVFCWDWVQEHWSDTLEPKLVDHIELTLIAVSIGFVLAFALALLAHRFGRLDSPIGIVAALVYTVPSIALFQILITSFGISTVSIEIALVGYSLVILYPNIVAGLRAAPPDVLEAARGMGLRPRQVLLRVELPLAVPSIIAGLRIAVVSTVSIATIAAILGGRGLGQPIFDALALPTPFKTEIYAAAVLVVALALTCDLLLVLLRRVLAPWTRVAR